MNIIGFVHVVSSIHFSYAYMYICCPERRGAWDSNLRVDQGERTGEMVSVSRFQKATESRKSYHSTMRSSFSCSSLSVRGTNESTGVEG